MAPDYNDTELINDDNKGVLQPGAHALESNNVQLPANEHPMRVYPRDGQE